MQQEEASLKMPSFRSLGPLVNLGTVCLNSAHTALRRGRRSSNRVSLINYGHIYI
jgi:hypothetical protein